MGGLFAQLARPAAVDPKSIGLCRWRPLAAAHSRPLPRVSRCWSRLKFRPRGARGELEVRGRLGRPTGRSASRLQRRQESLAGHCAQGCGQPLGPSQRSRACWMNGCGAAAPMRCAPMSAYRPPAPVAEPYTSFIAVEERIARPAGEALGKGGRAQHPSPGGRLPGVRLPAHSHDRSRQAVAGELAEYSRQLLLRVLRQPEVDHVPGRGH